MATKSVLLSDLVEALEMVSDDAGAYLDRETGEVFVITEDMTCAGSEDERYVALPCAFDLHEWGIMQRFCETLSNADMRERLSDAIRGRGAFRRFKDELHRNSLWDAWNEFKSSVLQLYAIEWCEENGIPFKR